MDTAKYSKIPAKNYRKLPDRPNLEHLKEQAKDLLREFKAGNPKAEKRIGRFISAEQIERGVRLKDAQHTLACEYTTGPYKIGSWEMLTEFVEAVLNLTSESMRQWMEKSTSKDPSESDMAHRIINRNATKHEFKSIYVEGMSHPDHYIRTLCMGELDHSDVPMDEDIRAALRKAAEDSAPKVRRVAIHTLFCQRCKDSPAPMDADFLARVSVKDESGKTRSQAFWQLTQHPDREAAAAALRRIKESAESPEIAARAAKALVELPKKRPRLK